jgi:glucose/arabinose dehydrogenase
VIDVATGGVRDMDIGARPLGVAVGSRGDVFVTHSDGGMKMIDAASNV